MFMPLSSGCIVFSASGTSASAALPTKGKAIHVINKGGAQVFVELGGSSVVASADNSYPVMRSSVAELYRSEEVQTHMAVRCAAGEDSIVHAITGYKA